MKRILFLILSLIFLSACDVISFKEPLAPLVISTVELIEYVNDELTDIDEIDGRSVITYGAVEDVVDYGKYKRVYLYDGVVCDFYDIEGISVDIEKFDRINLTGIIDIDENEVTIANYVKLDECVLDGKVEILDADLEYSTDINLEDYNNLRIQISGLLIIESRIFGYVKVGNNIDECLEFVISDPSGFDGLVLGQDIVVTGLVVPETIGYKIVDGRIISEN